MDKKYLIIVAMFTVAFVQIAQTKTDPLSKKMQEMRQALDKRKRKMSMLPQTLSSGFPAITQTYDKSKKMYILRIDLPGYEEEDISIHTTETASGTFLHVSAKKEHRVETKTKTETEIKFEKKEEAKKFEISEKLKPDADSTRINWKYKDKILTIKIPQKSKTRIIKKAGSTKKK